MCSQHKYVHSIFSLSLLNDTRCAQVALAEQGWTYSHFSQVFHFFLHLSCKENVKDGYSFCHNFHICFLSYLTYKLIWVWSQSTLCKYSSSPTHMLLTSRCTSVGDPTICTSYIFLSASVGAGMFVWQVHQWVGSLFTLSLAKTIRLLPLFLTSTHQCHQATLFNMSQ